MCIHPFFYDCHRYNYIFTSKDLLIAYKMSTTVGECISKVHYITSQLTQYLSFQIVSFIQCSAPQQMNGCYIHLLESYFIFLP